MKQIVDFIPNLPKKPYRNDKPEGIVFHTTGIMDKTNDTVERNRRVFTSAYVVRSKSFVHGFVDDISYWQSADYNFSAWGAGYVANERYIHIELCDTKDKDKFKKAYDNSIQIIVEVLRQYGLKPFRKKTLWTHYEVAHTLGGTTHTDPVPLFNYHKVSLDEFYKDVENAFYKKEVAGVSNEPTLNADQEKIRQEAMRLGITDGNNPFRQVNQYYLWNAMIQLAKEIEELKNKIK